MNPKTKLEVLGESVDGRDIDLLIIGECRPLIKSAYVCWLLCANAFHAGPSLLHASEQGSVFWGMEAIQLIRNQESGRQFWQTRFSHGMLCHADLAYIMFGKCSGIPIGAV